MKLIDIFQPVPDMQLFHEDFATDPSITFPDFDPRYSKVVGTVDSKDVWGSRFYGVDHTVFAFRDGDTLQAFIVVGTSLHKSHHPLNRVWASPVAQGQGYVTALVQFVMKKLEISLCITPDEGLTDDGWKWLIKSVKANRVTAKDATGNIVGIDQLQAEYQNRTRTNTVLFLEREITTTPIKLFGTGYRTLREMAMYIGDTRLD